MSLIITSQMQIAAVHMLQRHQYLIEQLVQQLVYPSAEQALLPCHASTLDAGVPPFADACCVCLCMLDSAEASQPLTCT